MKLLPGRRLSLSLLAASMSLSLAEAARASDLGDITVTGTREETPRAETPGTVGLVTGETLQETRPGHPAEVVGRIAGAHVSVTNGEGHATAIRQPLTTGAVYLYLEDGIPTRSTGFFNHNALYEVNLPQAGGIEITKGPGTSLYGSDAIGGVVNVLTRAAPLEAQAQVNLEGGAHGWRRLMASGGDTRGSDGLRAEFNATHSDGWRSGTEYDRQSGSVRWDRFTADGASVKTVLSVSNVDQQTAGSSTISKADYEHDPTANYTPISYREVQAVRLSTAYEKESAHTLWSVTPFVRHNAMDYMPNWSLSYDPNVTESENDSFGVLLKYRRDFAPMRTRLIVGADLDHSPGSRLEHSIDAVKDGDVYTSYTVTDTIYDYDVAFTGVSPYAHLESSPSERLRLNAGLRYDRMRYDYDNRMADGPLVLTPASTGFPVTYNHPADTQVDFDHFSPKLGATYAFSPNLNGFVAYRHAFRVPSESQLFRPGRAADTTTELDPVKVDSHEIGVRGTALGVEYEASVYHMTKKDDLVTFQYADGSREVMNAGETLHRGIELAAGTRLAETVQLRLAYSRSEHTYEDWKPNGTTDYSGNEMASAPKDLANLRIEWRPGRLAGARLELEWEHLGSYWMDDANTVRYGGHDLLNLRAHYPLGPAAAYLRVMNLADARYATSARYTRGAEEFAPGTPRSLYAGIDYVF